MCRFRMKKEIQIQSPDCATSRACSFASISDLNSDSGAASSCCKLPLFNILKDLGYSKLSIKSNIPPFIQARVGNKFYLNSPRIFSLRMVLSRLSFTSFNLPELLEHLTVNSILEGYSFRRKWVLSPVQVFLQEGCNLTSLDFSTPLE